MPFEIDDYIFNAVKPEEIDPEIEVKDRDRLGGLSCSSLIQSLIWNGSIRTLRGEPQPIPHRKYHKALERLIEFQTRALSLERQPPNDIYFFLQLLADEKIYQAIDSFLPKLAKESEPKTLPLSSDDNPTPAPGNV